MGREIERKYRVKSELWNPGSARKEEILQGYLLVQDQGVLRVRLIDGNGILSVKMRIEGSVRSRNEFEYPIPSEEARQLLALCTRGVTKVRHHFPHEGRVWHVDTFSGELQGLMLAEIELGSEEETFLTPPFIGEEVTGDPQFMNSALARPGFLPT